MFKLFTANDLKLDFGYDGVLMIPEERSGFELKSTDLLVVIAVVVLERACGGANAETK
jgi:hypothetical protein